MDERFNEILCTHCNENYITRERFEKYGKCLSCQRRETIAKTTGNEYIMYKDLPQQEKDRLAKQRETNNRWAKNRKMSTKTTAKDKVKTVSNNVNTDVANKEFLVGKFIGRMKYNTLNFISIKSTDLYDKFVSYCASHYYDVLPRTEFYSILVDKYGFQKKMSNGDNYYYRGNMENKSFAQATRDVASKLSQDNTTENTDTNLRYNQIYTPEMVEDIKATASELISVAELRKIIADKYPDKNITPANFNNIIVRQNIPHLKGKGRRAKTITETVVVNPAKSNQIKPEPIKVETKEEVKEVKEVKEEKEEPIKTEVVIQKEGLSYTEPDTTLINNEEQTDVDGDPIRLQPIKAEVVKVLQTKFKAMKCATQYDFLITDYIKLFEMLEYLADNCDDILKKRNDQYDIANLYQDDVVHEMENELAKPR